jgi:hypothetical protein
VFRVEDEAGLHTIELVATVEEFDDGSCSITPPKQTRGVWMPWHQQAEPAARGTTRNCDSRL